MYQHAWLLLQIFNDKFLVTCGSIMNSRVYSIFNVSLRSNIRKVSGYLKENEYISDTALRGFKTTNCYTKNNKLFVILNGQWTLDSVRNIFILFLIS